jgi:hypothetical protein
MPAPKRQLNPLEQADLASMFFELSHDPKTRPYVAKLVKAKFPDRAASFTDVEHQDQLQALRNELAQKEQLNQAREFQRALDKQRDDLITAGKYTKEQADEIKQIIDRHGSTLDYNQAAVLYAHEKPPVNPMDGPPDEQRMGATWEFPTVNGRDGKPIPFADFAKNPTTAAQNAAYTVISEFKKRSGIRA